MKSAHRRSGIALTLVATLLATATAAPERASVNASGGEPDGPSFNAVLSRNARFVAFTSTATNLVQGDGNAMSDIFVRDLETGENTRVSVSSAGVEANGSSERPSISDDGRYVCFKSDASNLVADDGNGASDIFVHDRQTGETTRVSVRADGTEANGDCDVAAISGNGRYVVFDSVASNLADGDGNGDYDVFVRDLRKGTLTIASVGRDGTQSDGGGFVPRISDSGRFVLFTAQEQAFLDSNPEDQGFYVPVLKDMKSGKTYRAIRSADGAPLDDSAFGSTLSGNGKWVAFATSASNVAGGVAPGGFSQAYRVKAKGGVAEPLSRVGSDVANGNVLFLAISDSGTAIAYQTVATNLLPADPNSTSDIYVADRRNGSLSIVSRPDGPGVSDGPSAFAALSGDGRTVAFHSSATNLGPTDQNEFQDVYVVTRP